VITANHWAAAYEARMRFGRIMPQATARVSGRERRHPALDAGARSASPRASMTALVLAASRSSAWVSAT
jgi:hypothetical protein